MRLSELQAARLQGVFTAIVSPFTADAKALDVGSFERLLQAQLKAGVNGIVLCGSTGEGQTLTLPEYRVLIAEAQRIVAGRCPLIVGICASSTALACEYARSVNQGFSEAPAANQQANAIMVVVPPYNKPTQAGIVAHFEAIAQQSALPLIAYNVPGRTACPMTPATLAELYRRELVVGYKDASGSLEHTWDCLQRLEDLKALGRFAYFCGDDALTQSMYCAGASGVISILSNVRPALMLGISDAMRRADFREAAHLQRQALAHCRAMFLESNPIPVKMALAQAGLIDHPSLRLPLQSAAPATAAELQRVLETSHA